MISLSKKIFASIFIIPLLFLTGAFALAEEPSLAAVETEKTQLQNQLQDIEKQIAQYQKDLTMIKGQKNTLKNKLSLLKKRQVTLNLQIKAIQLQISDVSGQLIITQNRFQDNLKKIETLKQQIGEDIRLINENDSRSFLFIILSKKTLFDALAEMQSFKDISAGLGTLIDQTHKTNEALQKTKEQLDEQQVNMSSLLSVQQLQQQALIGSVGEQSDILTKTKGKEKNYQIVLSESQKAAAKIKTRLYQLLDVGKQITFGQAVEIANWVSVQTGVRTAFLLAILTQESNLGRNVGTCNRPGDPPEKSWKVIMKPTRDQEPFLQITKNLGMDPDTTAVSCPMRDKKGNQIGWGGAMGPAQFIPSTWLGYKDKVSALTGKSANPWDIRDAFIASAIKLKADGAGSKDGEWSAAMKYFSGSTNTRFRFYGDNVIATAEQYESDIEALKKN